MHIFVIPYLNTAFISNYHRYKITKKIICLIIFTLFYFTHTKTTFAEEIQVEAAKKVYHAFTTGEPWPLLPNITSIDTAYTIQRLYVQLRQKEDKIIGYKSGLVTPNAYLKFGLNAPVTGVLFSSDTIRRRHHNAYIVCLHQFNRLMIEIELGAILAKDIKHTPKNIEELKQVILGFVAVVELPDLGFSENSKLTGVDIIGSNVGVKKLILGTPILKRDIDPNNIMIKLWHNQQQIMVGRSNEKGSQWDRLIAMLDNILKHRETVAAGSVLITGAIERVIKGDEGIYNALWEGMGKISFEVAPKTAGSANKSCNEYHFR